jgi:hypothetical protein
MSHQQKLYAIRHKPRGVRDASWMAIREGKIAWLKSKYDSNTAHIPKEDAEEFVAALRHANPYYELELCEVVEEKKVFA